MKNFAVLSLFLLLAVSVGAQVLAEKRPEIALRAGANLNGWDNSQGKTIGLAGFVPLAGRWGLATAWQFGQNSRTADSDFFIYDARPLRFFTTQIGLARTSKGGHWRVAAGISHQYLPKPLPDDYYYGFGFCGTGLTTDEMREIQRNYEKAQRLGKYGLNAFGGYLAGEFRWAMGRRLFGSAGATLHAFQSAEALSEWMEPTFSLLDLNLGIGLRP